MRRGQHPRGHIGITLALQQNEKTAVIGDKTQTAGALARTPADVGFARLERQSRTAETKQRDPLAVQLRDIAQRLPAHPCAVQGMLLFEETVKTFALFRWKQTNSDPAQNWSLQRLRLL